MISLDTETTGLDLYHGAAPYLVTICDEEGENTWWEFDVNPNTRKVSYDKQSLIEIQEVVDDADEVVFQNPKFDVLALSVAFRQMRRRFKMDWSKVRDTLLAGHLLRSNQAHDLTTMALVYLSLNVKPFEDAVEKATKCCRNMAQGKNPKYDWRIANKDLPEMPSAKETTWKYDMWLPRYVAGLLEYEEDHEYWTVCSKYANSDSAVTIRLYVEQLRRLQVANLDAIYNERLKVLPIVFAMEGHGVTLSKPRLREQREEYSHESKIAADRCYGVAKRRGYDLDLPKAANNKSLLGFVFGEEGLHLPPIERSTKTGAPSLKARVVEEYLLTLPPKSDGAIFLQNLRDKRKRDTAVTYMTSYEKYWIPLESNGEPLWYRIHPSLNPTGTDTLRWSSSNPNEQNICFDGETEVLTTEGWVRADTLTSEHLIAQYWASSKRIEFVNPEIHSPHFVGNMQKIETHQHIALLVTPAHRCLVVNRKTLKTLDIRADEFKGDYRHFHAGNYEGGDLSLSRDEVTWLCAVQADGSYHKTDDYNYGIGFTFTKKRKADRLRKCLKALKITFTESIRGNLARFYVKKSNSLVDYVKWLMPNKQFGKWVVDLCRDSLDYFCEEVFFWDGDFTRERVYTSSDKENVDWVQIAFTLSGSRAWQYTKQSVPGWSVRPHHYLNVTKDKDHSLTTNFTTENIAWNGPVYCVTVPSSYLVIRRNGKVSITGNSKKEGFNIRRAFGPAPGREWWSMDANNIELRVPAYESGEKELIKLFENSHEPPYYGSVHLLNFSTVYPDIWAKELRAVGFDRVGPHCKSKYASTWYQYCKNGDFAVQYGAVLLDNVEGTADKAFHRPGSHALLKERFTLQEQLNQEWISFANKYGYVETLPDTLVDPNRGYPLYCSRTRRGYIKPTIPLNYHVQGTAMWWMMIAMIACQEYLDELNAKPSSKGYYMIAQVHDEILFDFPFKKGARNLPKVRRLANLMSSVGERIGIPTPVSISYYLEDWAKETPYEFRN